MPIGTPERVVVQEARAGNSDQSAVEQYFQILDAVEETVGGVLEEYDTAFISDDEPITRRLAMQDGDTVEFAGDVDEYRSLRKDGYWPESDGTRVMGATEGGAKVFIDYKPEQPTTVEEPGRYATVWTQVHLWDELADPEVEDQVYSALDEAMDSVDGPMADW